MDDKITIVERLRYILSCKDITVNAFAKLLDMSQTTIFRQVKGEQALSAKTLERTLNVYPEISAEWLMRGEGEAFVENDNRRNGVEESTKGVMAAEASPYYNKEEFVEAITWKSKYEELEKRYNQLLGVALGGKK